MKLEKFFLLEWWSFASLHPTIQHEFLIFMYASNPAKPVWFGVIAAAQQNFYFRNIEF